MAAWRLAIRKVLSLPFNRNIQFFGIESQQKVTESFVVVIGLGGVGSHAANMLLRSGVGRLLLVDFDQVLYCTHRTSMKCICIKCFV